MILGTTAAVYSEEISCADRSSTSTQQTRPTLRIFPPNGAASVFWIYTEYEAARAAATIGPPRWRLRYIIPLSALVLAFLYNTAVVYVFLL